MKRFLIILSCIFVFSTAHAELKYPALNSAGYAQLQEMVTAILHECPPPKCLVVFPGRSNVLLSAYMDAKKMGHQVSLPVSGIRRMDPESVSKAKPRFTQEVLEKFLKQELKLVEKIAVVDFVNSGGSIANASQWIQDFAQEIEHPLKVQVLSYGNGVPSDIEAILGKSSISVKHLSFGMSEGSPTKLASGSLLEHFAPYGEWNPITTTENPKFNTTIRRDYPYLVNGKKEYSQYASYEDLVEWLKKEEFKPQLPSPQNCLFNTLGGML